MKRICIAIADAARARVFTFEELGGPAGTPTQELHEVFELVDPDRRRRAGELFSDTRPGSNRTPSGRGHAAPDHREAHLDELDRHFAAEIITRLSENVREHGFHRLIVAASPRILGELRKAGVRLFESGLTVDDVNRDLTHLTPSQIHDHLAERGLLPARERVTGKAP